MPDTPPAPAAPDPRSRVLGPPPPAPPSIPRMPAVGVAAVAITALVAAAILPRGGLGWSVVALTAAGGVVVARRAANTSAGDEVPPDAEPAGDDEHTRAAPRPDRWRRTVAALAFALAAVPAWTDAVWMQAVCVLAALGAGLTASGVGRSWSHVVTASWRVVPAWASQLAGWLAGAGGVLPGRGRWGRAVATTMVTLVLVAGFGGLFASADATFARLARWLVPDVTVDTLILRAVVAAAVASVVLALVGLRHEERAPSETRWLRLSGSEWQVPLIAVVGLFAAFVAVQIGALFGGDAFVQATAGVTYASHAREGFGQLALVAALVLPLVGALGRYAAPRHDTDDRLRRGLSAVLLGLTLVVLASATHRLWLYIAALGWTPLRVSVLAVLAWLAVVVIATLVVAHRRRTDVLPRFVIAWTAIALLAFALARPDALIAHGNVARYEATGQLDPWVLAQLSDDAAPALARLPAPVRACVDELRPHDGSDELRPHDGSDPGWQSANLASWRASRLPSTPSSVACLHHPLDGSRQPSPGSR